MSCVKDDTFYDESKQQCEHCSSRSLGLVLFTTLVGIALLSVLGVVCYRKCNPQAQGVTRTARKTAARTYMRVTMLVRDTHLLVRLKIMVGFYQVVGVLRTTYRVPSLTPTPTP